MPTTETPTFRKTAETFKAAAKTLPQQYFVSPEVFARASALCCSLSRWTIALACLVWLLLLAGILLAPELTHSSHPGKDLTRDTVRRMYHVVTR